MKCVIFLTEHRCKNPMNREKVIGFLRFFVIKASIGFTLVMQGICQFHSTRLTVVPSLEKSTVPSRSVR